MCSGTVGPSETRLDDDHQIVRKPRSGSNRVRYRTAPLATLIDHLTEFEYPIAFQVVWQRKAGWVADAELRIEDVRDGRDTFSQRSIGLLFEPSDVGSEEHQRPIGTEARNRIDRIEAKHPKRTFTVNARAVALPTCDGTEANNRVETQLDQLAQSLNALDGPFYELEGRRLRSKGILNRTKRKRARTVLKTYSIAS